MKIEPNTSPALSEQDRPDEVNHQLDEKIRHRAYELYEQRGRVNGHDQEDWLQAEAEITRLAKAA